MPGLLLLLCLLGCPGAHASPEEDEKVKFDLQGSIIVNQLAISQIIEEQQTFSEGISSLQSKLENLTETLSSFVTLRDKRYREAQERDNVTRWVLDKLEELETKNLTLACDIESAKTAETERLRQENTQLQEDSYRVKEELTKVEEINRELENDLRQIEEENLEKTAQIRQLEDDLRCLQEKSRDLEQASADAEEVRNETASIVAELERKNAQQDRENRLVEAEKSLLEEKLAKIEEENRRLQEANTILDEENREKEEHNSRIEAEKSEIEAKNRLMEEENLMCERNVTEWSTRMVMARDCAELYCTGIRKDGVYTVSPGSGKRLVNVWCDMTTSGGGWTLFVHRQQEGTQEDFSRDWQQYKQGFGNTWAEHWIGNEALHQLTTWTDQVLRLEATNLEGELRWAQWSTFSVGAESSSYQLKVGEYERESSLGDSMVEHHSLNDRKFSTKDRDNDGASQRDCVESFSVGGGWWYNNCAYITPTGPHSGSGKHMLAFWTPEDNVWISLSRLQMMVRPKNFPACEN